MKILLLHDVDRLGNQGEVVSVRPGFARNYLIPKRLACVPHPGAEKELALIRRKQEKLERQLVTQAEEIRSRLEKIPSVSLELRANAEGTLFGSVSPSMISDALREQGLRVDGKQVEIDEPIRTVGEFQVRIRLHKEIATSLKVAVQPTQEVRPERSSGISDDEPEPPPES